MSQLEGWGNTPQTSEASAAVLGDRRQSRAGRVFLGWRVAPAVPDPGPPPTRPVPRPARRLEPGWAAAQRRIAGQLTRPARAGLAGCAMAGILIAGLWLADAITAGLAVAVAGSLVIIAVACARSVWRARRLLSAAMTAEQVRLGAVSGAERARHDLRQQEHAAEYDAWYRQHAARDGRPDWMAVSVPAQIDRIDVAGGTLAGWSALSTTIAAPLLEAGAAVTVLDLTEGPVAADLIGYAGRCGLRPLVWVLPGDLPRLDLSAELDAPAMADVLALAVAAGAEDERSGDLAADCALLERVLGVLGPRPRVARITAALRVLAEVGDPRADIRAGLLTGGQLEELGQLFGRGAAGRVVTGRAFALEARLRGLDGLGAELAAVAPSSVRVVALDRRAGAVGNRMLATYLVAALTQLLRQAPPGEPWARTLLVLGADRVKPGVLDLLTGACEGSRTGLVLAFRSIGDQVRTRLGRGNAALAFMRLGNGDDAKAASELIGTEHRFVISQLTETLGSSVTDTWGDSYTSTVGTSGSLSDSYSVADSSGSSQGHGGTRADLAPFGAFTASASWDSSRSRSRTASVSLTEGVSAGTSWGVSLSRALGENSSLARTSQRSREFLVEAEELQRLPATAVLVSYASQAGRDVVLADANPALMAWPGSGFGGPPGGPPGAAAGPAGGLTGAGTAGGLAAPAGEWPPPGGPPPASEPPPQAGRGLAARERQAPGLLGPGGERGGRPNLGPPPRRLDWRRPR